MLISVVAIFYNSESWCRRCIDSILKQKDVDLELIAVDDASPDDNTLQILQEYEKQDSRVRVFQHEKNMGISEARNTGLAQVRGDVFYLIDGDDWLAEDTSLKKLAAHWTHDVDWVCGSYQVIDEKGVVQRYIKFSDLACRSSAEIVSNFSLIDFVYTHNRLINSKYKNIKFRSLVHEDRFWNVEVYPSLSHVICCSDITYSYYSRTASFSSGSFFKRKFSEDGLQLLKEMWELGGPWIYFTRVLAVTILKSCYCSSCTRQYRKFLTHSLYEKGIFPCDFSLKGCPRFTQIVYLLVDKRCPDVLIRLFVKLYLFYLFKIRKTTF